jgi:hypothetical protein
MSILSVEIPREVVGDYQHAAGDIDAATVIKTGGGSVVLIQAEAQNVRLTFHPDNTPTAAYGHLLLAGTSLTVNIGANKALSIKAMGVVANAILNVTSFR